MLIVKFPVIVVVNVATGLVNKDEYIIYYAYSTKCHLLMINLVAAFVLFIFMPILLHFCVTTVSRRIKIYIIKHSSSVNVK